MRGKREGGKGGGGERGDRSRRTARGSRGSVCGGGIKAANSMFSFLISGTCM